MEILKIENLSKIYGKDDTKVVALDQVSLSIERGEFVSIIGESGSGKSTLLHLIGGLDTPSSGEIYIEGKKLSQIKPSKLANYRRRQIGIIYQFYNLVPILTVKENIELPLLLDGRKADKEKLNELIKVLKLEDKVNAFPSQLSGGQQQRVAIGRAIIAEPSIILADEPTGNLDTKNSNDIISYLKYTSKKFHQTIMLVTHSENIAMQTDRIIKLSDGKIEFDKKIK
jgi:putative ABC transport system ATP-binding protein